MTTYYKFVKVYYYIIDEQLQHELEPEFALLPNKTNNNINNIIVLFARSTFAASARTDKNNNAIISVEEFIQPPLTKHVKN